MLESSRRAHVSGAGPEQASAHPQPVRRPNGEWESAVRRPSVPALVHAATGRAQRKPACSKCGGTSQAGSCPSCEEEARISSPEPRRLEEPITSHQPKLRGTLERPGADAVSDERHDPAEQQADAIGDRIGGELEGAGNVATGALPERIRGVAERQLGVDLSGTELRADASAADHAAGMNAVAVTEGSRVSFTRGALSTTSSEGRAVLGHELTHVAQQHAHGSRAAQRKAPNEERDFTGPLEDREWALVQTWLSLGEVGTDPLTADENRNADIVAAAIFCSRALSTLIANSREDPLLCLDTDVTAVDPRVQRLRPHVLARGAIINWVAVPPAGRFFHVIDRLVQTHRFPVNAAAGIAGNLAAESGVLPSRVEGSRPATPLRAPSFGGAMTDFTPEQVMNRNRATGTGPRLPGVGLAQWTTAQRRSALFQQTQGGRALGSTVLFNMDAQVDFLAGELGASPALNARLMAAGISVNDAADEILYNFEIPGSILDAAGNKLPRTDPAVQAVFRVRRANAQAALQAYQAELAARGR